MESLKFKTNIKSTKCVAKVTHLLNNEMEIKKWEVDILNPEKILTVKVNNNDSKKIIEHLKKQDLRQKYCNNGKNNQTL